MASRAVWKGQLRLSLVSIPVEIHSATKSGARIRFRQIHKPTGKPVRYEKTVAGVGPVKADDIMKGYEVGEDEYLLIEPAEIDAIKLETKKTLELVQFVGACEIPPLYFDKPYYVVPSDELAEDAYRVVRDALRQSEKVGLGQLTMRGKEHLCAIKPCGDGLLLETLFYADEIKEAEPLFSNIDDDTPDDDLLSVANQLIERKTAPFNAENFEDRYNEAMRALIEQKRSSKKTPRASRVSDADAQKGSNVIDLMAALRQSLDADGGTKRRSKTRRRQTSKATAGKTSKTAATKKSA